MKVREFSNNQFGRSEVPSSESTQTIRKITTKLMSHQFFKNGMRYVEIAVEKGIGQCTQQYGWNIPAAGAKDNLFKEPRTVMESGILKLSGHHDEELTFWFILREFLFTLAFCVLHYACAFSHTWISISFVITAADRVIDLNANAIFFYLLNTQGLFFAANDQNGNKK